MHYKLASLMHGIMLRRCIIDACHLLRAMHGFIPDYVLHAPCLIPQKSAPQPFKSAVSKLQYKRLLSATSQSAVN